MLIIICPPFENRLPHIVIIWSLCSNVLQLYHGWVKSESSTIPSAITRLFKALSEQVILILDNSAKFTSILKLHACLTHAYVKTKTFFYIEPTPYPSSSPKLMAKFTTQTHHYKSRQMTIVTGAILFKSSP